jgi:hypothetical protein
MIAVAKEWRGGVKYFVLDDARQEVGRYITRLAAALIGRRPGLGWSRIALGIVSSFDPGFYS